MVDYSGVNIIVLPEVSFQPGMLSREGRNSSTVSVGDGAWLPDNGSDPFTRQAIESTDRDKRIHRVLEKATRQYPSLNGDTDILEEAIEFVDGNSQLATIFANKIQKNPDEYQEIMDLVWARLGGKVTESKAAEPLKEENLEAMSSRLGQLNESDAAALLLVENYHESMKKIADIIGCSDQTIGNSVKKWKQMLAREAASRQCELPLPGQPVNTVTVFDQVDDLEALLKPRRIRSNAGRKSLAEGARIAAKKAAIEARQGRLF